MSHVFSRRGAVLFSALATLVMGFASSLADPPIDFDGDGVPDESGPIEGPEEEVAVFSGAGGTILQIFGAPHPNGLFGFATAIVADASGDGNPDMLTTAPLTKREESWGIIAQQSARAREHDAAAARHHLIPVALRSTHRGNNSGR